MEREWKESRSDKRKHVKVRESVSVEISAGRWSLAAPGSRRSALMQRRGTS